MEPWQRDLAEYREAQFQAYREKRERFGEPITCVSKRKESDMKRYFDYSEKERSEMTAETVESLMARELMEAGVVAPEKPVLEEVPTFEAQKTRVYRIKDGYRLMHGFAFKTLADAEAFTKLSVVDIETSYGCDITYFKNFDRMAIEADEIVDWADYIRIKEVAEKARAAKKANEKMTADYNAECKASTEITDGVWSDWRECREKAARFARILKVADEYLQMCDGSEAVAFRFLTKSYPVETLREVDAWCGTSLANPVGLNVAEEPCESAA